MVDCKTQCKMRFKADHIDGQPLVLWQHELNRKSALSSRNKTQMGPV